MSILPKLSFLQSLGVDPQRSLKRSSGGAAGGVAGGGSDSSAEHLKKMIATEPRAGADESTREYFFASSVDAWYEKAPEITFPTEFVSISSSEARAIISYWDKTSSKLDAPPVSPIPSSLADLVARADAVIRDRFDGSAFVKLTTRSPKDSKTLFRKAEAALLARLSAETVGGPGGGAETAAAADNARLVAFSEEMVKAAVVRSGAEAVTLLLDSERVAEDLKYAYDEGASVAPISLVVRAWDVRIRPQCEFRAFVANNKITCIGQYWHSLFFPELAAVKDVVAADCIALFERAIQRALPVPVAMLDLAWLGPGSCLLIEVNPLCEGLGSFRGSTGLFDYEADAALLAGRAPFEIRIRTEPEDKASMQSHMSSEWRRVIYSR